jgi:hypothetical protein
MKPETERHDLPPLEHDRPPPIVHHAAGGLSAKIRFGSTPLKVDLVEELGSRPG